MFRRAAAALPPQSDRAAPQEPQVHAEEVIKVEKEVFVEEAAAEEAPVEAEVQAETNNGSEASNTDNLAPVSNRPNVYNRLIIKNAEVEMLVEDTDTAINRSLGIVTEYSGYVVSNRTWFSDGLKYATVTIGVPSENFEQMMRRLKELAVSVTNESVSGQDVTDEFVDLESRLRNLEATGDRIRSFMEQAKSIDESLEVSAQLSQIEAEIEQVKGRMTYLKDRASFSTITLQIAPQVILPTPTPTFTPTPTATPQPTATPVVWSASRTYDQAATVTKNTTTSLFQFTIDLLIWLIIVGVPFVLPVVIVIWIGVRIARRLGIGNPLRPPSA